ncbi:TPA: hypothetical protein U5E37_004261 [Yersinia enterocolitica]|nr:hypothetical protein [Yersinia enterocolitica]
MEEGETLINMGLTFGWPNGMNKVAKAPMKVLLEKMKQKNPEFHQSSLEIK